MGQVLVDEGAVCVGDLGDEVIHAAGEDGRGEQEGAGDAVEPGEFAGADGLWEQAGIADLGVDGVKALVDVGAAEGLAEHKLDAVVGGGVGDEGDAGIEGRGGVALVVVADGYVEGEGFGEGDLVLQVGSREKGRGETIEDRRKRVEIVGGLVLAVVVAVFEAGEQEMAVDGGVGGAEFRAPQLAVGDIDLGAELGGSLDGILSGIRGGIEERGIDIGSVVDVSVGEEASREIPYGGVGVFAFEVNVLVRIDSAVAGIAEDGSEGSGGDSLFAGSVGGGEVEIPVRDGGQGAAEMVVINVAGDAVVGVGGVVLGIEEGVVAAAAVKGSGEQKVDVADLADRR